MGDMSNAYKYYCVNLKRRYQWEDLGVDRKIMLQ
jgi:hypothetical protein